VEGPTLRRPWLGWISTVASGSVLAVALALMSIADAAHPGAHPERVVSTIGPRREVDHPGGRTAIHATGARARPRVRGRTPARAPVAETQPFGAGAAPQIQVQLAMSLAPDAGVMVGGKTGQLDASPAPPTSAAARRVPARLDEPPPRRRSRVTRRTLRERDMEYDAIIRSNAIAGRTGDHASACRSRARTGPMSNGGPSMTITCSACASR